MTQGDTSWEQEVRDRQGFRSQMVRTFGFTVMDHGVALSRCPECQSLVSLNSAFPDSDWNSIPHLVSVIETYLETQGNYMTCSRCQHGFNLSAKAGDCEYWLWHSHFLSEVKLDLQFLIHRKSGRTQWVEGMLIDHDGQIAPLPLPIAESEFQGRAGCYFSVRQAWREFLKQHWPISGFSGLRISDGYFLVINPAVDSDDDLTGFKDNCLRLVTASSQTANHYEFADLSWADSWNFEENTYHQWLPEFESDLEESDMIAGVLASPDQFYKVIEQELEPFGCWLKREGRDAQRALLGDDEYYVGFDFREYLINAMVKGYSYWGALRYIEPIVDSWERARDTGERLKSLLKSYVSNVYGGRYFQCRPRRGKKIVKEFDLLELQEAEDEVEDDQAFLEWIAPQIDLNPVSLKFEKVAKA